MQAPNRGFSRRKREWFANRPDVAVDVDRIFGVPGFLYAPTPIPVVGATLVVALFLAAAAALRQSPRGAHKGRPY